MNKQVLSYPLYTESLTAGALFYAIFGFMFATYKFSSSMEAGLLNMWLAFSTIAVLVYTGLFFHYGMNILRSTAEGGQTPPVLSGSLTGIAEGWRRCLRLIILLALFVVTARQLRSLGWIEGEWSVWIVSFLVMPALFTNNALYGTILTMLNPAALWTTMRNLGWVAVPILGLQALVAALAWTGLTGSTELFLLLFPLVLYCHFLYFHVIGLCVFARKGKFFAQVDFKADREQTKVVSDNLAELNLELSQAHEWLRAGQYARVLEKLDALLQRSGWDNFEKLFGYTSQWFDTGPAVHLCRRYLDNSLVVAQPVRALELAQWALTREPAMTVSRAGHLQALAEGAVIAAQYRTVLQLVENYLKSYPNSQQHHELVFLALGLAGEKLKDEVLHARLKATL